MDLTSSAPHGVNKRSLITFGVMLLATVRAIDMTITNVILANMMASLGASVESITWVATAYITATAAITPLLNLMTSTSGRKKVLIISALGFTVASFFCGIATSLSFMVIARVLQGAFGASLNPLAQSILIDSYPKDKSRVAMAIYGIGVMSAPIFAPLLGSYITEAINWRWVFFINIPICIFALLICINFISDSPLQKINIKWFDIAMIIVSTASLQIMLDKGNQQDWFSSNYILLLMIISLSSGAFYLYRLIKYPVNSVINKAIFKDRTFSLAFVLTLIFFAGVFGKLTIIPLMLSQLFHYPILQNGAILVPLGIASMLGIIISSKLMKYFDGRWFIVSGALLSMGSSINMAFINLQADSGYFILANFLQGLGIGLFFTPLSTIAYSTLPTSMTDQASALLNYARNFGSSLGIALLTSYVARKLQLNWQLLIGNIKLTHDNFIIWAQQNNVDYLNPQHQKMLANLILQQAGIKAYAEGFLLTAVIFSLLVPLAFFIKANNK